MRKVDYLIVGAGLFGSTFAHEATKFGKKCLVIDQRSHVGGNCYTEVLEGIPVHRYGAHIFHTSSKRVWDWVRKFGEFNNFINQPVAVVDGETFNMPFNMNMFNKVFGAVLPGDVSIIMGKETAEYANLVPSNLEEQALKTVGRTIYEKFIKGYTEKQWGRRATDLPASTLKRLPLRFTYDNNYFDDRYQGIPIGGYTKLFGGMLQNVEVILNVSYRDVFKGIEADKVIYTGMIDEYYDYCFGSPEYRSLKFVDQVYDTPNYQGVAVMNYPSAEIPYTRSIEHKHFDIGNEEQHTIVSYEYPLAYERGKNLIPYYPVGNSRNQEVYDKYLELTKKTPDIIFAGRLGSYQYNDMDDTINNALDLVYKEVYG